MPGSQLLYLLYHFVFTLCQHTKWFHWNHTFSCNYWTISPDNCKLGLLHTVAGDHQWQWAPFTGEHERSNTPILPVQGSLDQWGSPNIGLDVPSPEPYQNVFHSYRSPDLLLFFILNATSTTWTPMMNDDTKMRHVLCLWLRGLILISRICLYAVPF